MANIGSGTFEVDPVSRIEGHLGVRITTNGSGIITDAQAHGNLWRGFENFLIGRAPNDAITFVQRICGVCPVPHGMTSTYANDTVLGYSKGHITFPVTQLNGSAMAVNDGFGIPPKAVLIRNLVLGAEFLMSSITHFYHLAAPSYVQGPNIPPWTPYFDDSYYFELSTAASLRSHGKVAPNMVADGFGHKFSGDLWSAVIFSYVKALRIRRLTFEAGALFSGRMPMTSVLIGGGVTFDGTENLTDRCETYRKLMIEVGKFVIQEYVPIVLALGVLYPAFDNAGNDPLALSATHGIGAGLGRFLSWGGFPNVNAAGTLSLPGGVYDSATSSYVVLPVADKAGVYATWLTGANSVPTNLTEDIESSRYDIAPLDSTGVYGQGGNPATAAYPGLVSRTKPHRDKPGSYTYMKAPRWAGKSYEVGPFARMVVAGFYPADGTSVIAAGPLSAYYAPYLKTALSVSGLDPKMVSADIAVALVRCGIATLSIGAATYGISGALPVGPAVTNVLTGSEDLVAAYTNANAVITGAITVVAGLKGGLSTIDRLRGRGLESLYLVQEILGLYNKTTDAWAGGWLAQLRSLSGSGTFNGVTGTGANANDTVGSTWRNLPIPATKKQGWGGTEAPRGALMHQMEINAGKITKYQCIVPTTWNGSPATGGGVMKGAIEAAVIGAPFSSAGATFTKAGGVGTLTTAGGVEVLRIAQSFDPCIACAIH